jgi:alkanesulfonate monooxygenase SsuD/methylene tetrahydromethanopterin reductase-like flavin-dependent oxidoreductase (luciferase family)
LKWAVAPVRVAEIETCDWRACKSWRTNVGKIEFGVWDQMQTYEVMQAGSAADVYERHIQQAKLMEEVGFDYYWTLEHQGSYVGAITCPSVFLTAVAQHTERLRLGTMIWQLPFHNPIRLAEEVAMLDHLSRGRAEFGAGIGVHEHEFIRWGMNFYDRQEMGDEAMDILEMAWSGEPVTYHGKFYHFEEALVQPLPYQQPNIPIWAAVHSPRAIEFAAKRGYHMAQNIDTDDSMVEKFSDWRRLWAEAGHSGPMPKQFLMRVVHVAETDAKAREQAEKYIMESNTLGRELVATSQVGFGVNPRGTGTEDTPDIRERGRIFRECSKSFDFWVDNGLAIVGSPETVARKLAEGSERIGFNHFAGKFHIGRMPHAMVEDSIKLFGKEVLPAFS